MSTRSCIAKRAGDGWKGVYHHSDGYPSGLGCYIFRSIRLDFNGDVRAFLDYALSHDGGWSHIWPGAVYKRHPNGGDTVDASRPQPQCYCHGYFARRDKIKPGQGRGIITGCECGPQPYNTKDHLHGGGPSCDPLFIEWVYVLDPEARTMAVLKSHGEGIPSIPTITLYRHRLVSVANLDGPEPDWWELEKDVFNTEHLERRETWVDDILPPVERRDIA